MSIIYMIYKEKSDYASHFKINATVCNIILSQTQSI